jgi:hypothetical protein
VLERTQEEDGGAEGGRAVFMVVEQSSEAVSEALSLIEGPLNPGRRAAKPRLHVQKAVFYSLPFFM